MIFFYWHTPYKHIQEVPKDVPESSNARKRKTPVARVVTEDLSTTSSTTKAEEPPATQTTKRRRRYHAEPAIVAALFSKTDQLSCIDLLIARCKGCPQLALGAYFCRLEVPGKRLPNTGSSPAKNSHTHTSHVMDIFEDPPMHLEVKKPRCKSCKGNRRDKGRIFPKHGNPKSSRKKTKNLPRQQNEYLMRLLPRQEKMTQSGVRYDQNILPSIPT
ncbi:hypothetical protein V6N12_024432 [Hibiscus sabdariffa]|uniref:Uncharacterized protein n=1 Tax=Hibiscus sabdariffa TaxID=183260 RepID=A0ABR2G121_9ROSI